MTSPFETYFVPNRLPLRAKAEPLPMSRADMQRRGRDACDVVLVTGDAYVDHPSFGVALLGQFLEWLGYRVGIIARPDPADPLAFQALGRPLLFWGISAGNLDGDLARLTVMRKLRREDPYSPDGRPDRRVRNASIVYTGRARQAYPGVPVVLGGIEASLRRLAYYDYWTDRVKRSLLFDSKADLIAYGMAELAVANIAQRLREGRDLANIPGTARIVSVLDKGADIVELPSFEQISAPDAAGREAYAGMFKRHEAERLSSAPRPFVQQHGTRWLVVEPPARPLDTAEMDAIYALPFTHKPHPAYGAARIAAYDMIRDSITTHRGCYGACAFCAIAAHQGLRISSRSEKGLLAEALAMAGRPGFHGTISDVGGPTANMYRTGCRLGRNGCPERTCLTPEPCPNLEIDFEPAMKLLRALRFVPGVKHVFVSSGLRFDLMLAGRNARFMDEFVEQHVGGRLKIAPEHVADDALRRMRKPAMAVYLRFVERFRAAVARAKLPFELREYFISGHPGCTIDHMIELARYLKAAHIAPEQVQDFYPAPLTLAAAQYYSGLDPETGERVVCARTDQSKTLQRALLFCWKPEFREKAREALRSAGRSDLIGHGRDCLVPPGPKPARIVRQCKK